MFADRGDGVRPPIAWRTGSATELAGQEPGVRIRPVIGGWVRRIHRKGVRSHNRPTSSAERSLAALPRQVVRGSALRSSGPMTPLRPPYRPSSSTSWRVRHHPRVGWYRSNVTVRSLDCPGGVENCMAPSDTVSRKRAAARQAEHDAGCTTNSPASQRRLPYARSCRITALSRNE